MTVLCLTGWQQPADALANIAPSGIHFDYSAYADSQRMFAALPSQVDTAIGWSLGGQLLVRAIAGGHIKVQRLILLGAPFQWIADAHFPAGIPADIAKDVAQNYECDPAAMLSGFNTLIALGDKYEKQIVRMLNATEVCKNGTYWLSELARTSCRTLDFSLLPSTTLVHGLNDRVIFPDNAKAYNTHLTRSELHLWPECAHAPHLHDAEKLRQLIHEYV